MERLLALYKVLDETPVEQRDLAFNPLKAACEAIAQQNQLCWREVFAFAKREYFLRLRSEDKRHGR